MRTLHIGLALSRLWGLRGKSWDELTPTWIRLLLYSMVNGQVRYIVYRPSRWHNYVLIPSALAVTMPIAI
jgi:hypothetical protein